MSQVGQTYKEMWENGTWTPEYKDPRLWPQCCNVPMMRSNELSRKGHTCLICCVFREEQEICLLDVEPNDHQWLEAIYDNGPCKPFTPPAPDKAF